MAVVGRYLVLSTYLQNRKFYADAQTLALEYQVTKCDTAIVL